MTVSNPNNRNSYSGNGSTTVFAYTFKIANADHIKVTLVSSAGIETVETAYSVSGVGSLSGGNITMTTAPASGETLVITRNQPYTQDTDYVTGAAFRADTHEAALDELTMNDAQQLEVLDRAIQAPIQDGAIGNLPNISARENRMLSFASGGDPTATGFTTSEVQTLVNSYVSGSAITDASSVTYTPAGVNAVNTNVQDKLREQVSVTDFGAVGDDATDDTTAIQNALDYAWDNQVSLYFPAGTYKITAPLTMWASPGDDTKGINIHGENKWTTIIKKYGNTTVSNQLADSVGTSITPENVDCVMIIKSAWFKDNALMYLADYYTDNSTASNFKVEQMQFTWNGIYTDPGRVDMAVYSIAMKNYLFRDVVVQHTSKGFVTRIYNYFANFKKVRCVRTHTGYEFQTPIGGNTTTVFEECQVVGADLFGWKVKGNYIFRMCSVDGGLAVAWRCDSGTLTLWRCAGESPHNRGILHAESNPSGPLTLPGRIIAIDCGFAVGYDAGYKVFSANTPTSGDREEGCLIHLIRCSIGRIELGGYPSVASSTLYYAPGQNRVIFEDCRVTDEFATIQEYPETTDMKNILLNRRSLGTPRNNFWSFVLSSIVSGPADRATLSVTENGTTNRLDLSCSTPISPDNAGGERAIMFTSPVDLTDVSKVRMIATTEGFNTSNSAYLFLSSRLVADGYYNANSRWPADYLSVGADGHAYDQVDREYIISVEALFGSYYLGIVMPSGYSAPMVMKIKSIELLR